ncbi:50S ribosome-binding GTPase [Kocuria sp. p3-SID1433]|uniref:GTPase n=1 Tax=unclassified Kocuria TaxID=2649579 RepID=UPI0021A79569|nr:MULTISPECIES: GTPase [unclassified Kocuria]MCT1601105.1 50S ribosome-binding GTPase [Kocuria sp. p3-SID1428]MCT2179675.1 50S ribosome-binding GTPase [Kocuria sp. p3-SID1433]
MRLPGRRPRRDPHADLDQRLHGLREAVDLGRGRLDESALQLGEDVLTRAAGRRALSAEHTVVGFFGATGSGKSSLLNTLLGRQVARAALQRPTTSEPLAVLDGLPGADPLLDWLEVRDRRVLEDLAAEPWSQGPAGLWTPVPEGLILLDLPDVDSVAREHRQIASRLAGMVDVVVWVVDPQKYADAVLHDHFIAPLSRHASSTLVVLNQADRLPTGEVPRVLESLRQVLADDGLRTDGRSAPIAASAARGTGIGQLREAITEVVEAKAASSQRLSGDVDAAVEALQASQGTGRPEGVSPFARESLIDGLAAAAQADGIAEAASRSYVLHASRRTGWMPVRWLGAFRRDPLKRLHLQGAQEDGASDPSLHRSSLPPMGPAQRAAGDTAVRRFAQEASQGASPAWEHSIREAARSRGEQLPDALDQALARKDLRRGSRSWWWVPMDIVQWLLMLMAVAGLLWLTGLFALDYLQIPVPPTPQVQDTGIPMPTLLVVTGLVAGLVFGVLSAALARLSASRRRSRVRRRLREQIAGAAQTHVIDPVEAELSRQESLSEALVRARG